MSNFTGGEDLAKMWTVGELATELGVPKSTLRHAIRAAGVSPRLAGKTWVLTVEDKRRVDEWRRLYARR